MVIPTYNRSGILLETLERLAQQDFVKGEYEVIVVDDGSRDATQSVLESFAKKNLFPLRFFFQHNQGQGIARNRAVAQAHGKIIVFIGDDILVRPDFLKQHMEYHRQYMHEHEVVLGLTLWDARIPKTPFTEFMTSGGIFFGRFGGHQFAYDRLEGKSLADYNFFYTSNLSMKRSLLLKYPFDDSFHSYGWEDIELGYRLTKEVGMKLYYNPHAVADHFHPMDPESLFGRLKAIGKSAHILHKKYPELQKVPPFWKKMILRFVTNVLFLNLSERLMKRFPARKWHFLYYYLVSKKAFLEGIEEGI